MRGRPRADRTTTTQPTSLTTTTPITAPATTSTDVARPALGTPPGFKRINDTVHKLSIAVPPSWVTPVPGRGPIGEQLQTYNAQHPQLEPVLAAGLGPQDRIGLAVYAINPATRQVFFTNDVADGSLE